MYKLEYELIIFSLECTNNFVEVTYYTDSYMIICTFDDPKNITGKLCTIVYGNCDSQQMQQTLNGSSTEQSPNIVTLKLHSIDSNQVYCYNVTASNASYTVIVMGRIGELRLICIIRYSLLNGQYQVYYKLDKNHN